MKETFKILLVGINAKYSHTNLAIRYLKQMINEYDVEIYEPNINNHLEDIIRSIYQSKPNLLAFSCYIWNIEMVLKISKSIKKILPNIKIVLGGPEVSFEGVGFFREHPTIDFIIKGEGEVPFKELVNNLAYDKNSLDVKGLVTQEFDNGPAEAIELNRTIFPYQGEKLENLSNQILYYEASRGCPFSCSYCLSSTTKGVRALDTIRVKEELQYLSKHANMVKFVDRTFNCNPKATIDLLGFISNLNTKTTFHLEISAHLITAEILDIFKSMPKNRIQLEIGVQTTNPRSVEAIQRSTDFKALSRVVKTVNSYNNIHQHLDLIAGLPFEDYHSFKKSFDDVMGLSPHKLQLGFLKLLKGSHIRRDKDVHQFKFNDFPPYEVLENKYLSYDQLSDLKNIEGIVEVYYNSHRFDKALNYLHLRSDSYFDLYEKLYFYFRNQKLLKCNHSLNDYYKFLLDFGIQELNVDRKMLTNLVKFDYLLHKRTNTIPEFLGETAKIKERVFEFLKLEENVVKYLPNFIGTKPAEIYKQIIIDKFDHNPLTSNSQEVYLLFNYKLSEGVFDKPMVLEIPL